LEVLHLPVRPVPQHDEVVVGRPERGAVVERDSIDRDALALDADVVHRGDHRPSGLVVPGVDVDDLADEVTDGDGVPPVGDGDEGIAGDAARVAGVNAPVRRAGVPLVDGGVELHAGVGTGPGGVGDLVPQVAGTHRPLRAGGAALGAGLLLLGAPVQ